MVNKKEGFTNCNNCCRGYEDKDKIVLEVPNTSKCSRCGDIAKVNDFGFCKDTLVVEFMCDCGYIHTKEKDIKFV